MKHSHILLSLSLTVLLASCEESAPSLSTNIPTLDPVEVEDNGGLVFILKGTATNTPTVSDCGFYISHNDTMKDAEQYSSKLTGNSFAAEVTLQGYNRYYYVCSYISNGRTEIRSKTKMISISALEDYVDFGTVSINSYNRTTGKTSFSTTCSAAEGVNITKYGILWGTSEDLKTSGTSKELTFPADGKAFTFELPDLELGTQYYVCQYLTDSDVTAYGNTEKFKVYSFPIVELGDILNITSSSATVTGSVPDNGGALLQEKGIVYAEGDALPTVETGKVISYDAVPSEYYTYLTGLSPNKEYTVRAYAINSEGTSYSAERKKFKTRVGLPDVFTSSATSITSNSAVLNATLFFDGGETPSECGFYWSETSFTDPANATNVESSLSGASFSTTLSSLTRATTYYYQAYAVNSAGISYGDIRSFTTSVTLPTVTTAAVSGITEASATCGGNVTNDGGTAVTKRGVVWSSSPNPTISLSTKTVDGSGIGNFVSDLSGLARATQYYVRAYATSSKGTAYGEEITFNTKAAKASVLSLTATSVTSSSGIINASIEDDGGEAPSECGFYWSETQFTDPANATKVVSSLSGTSFSTTLSSLTRATTYYYQAYAKNSAGNSYGEVKSFTTSAVLPTVTTAAVSDITENSATCGGTVTDDGGASVTQRGVVWSTSPNPTVSLSTKTVDDSGIGNFVSDLSGLARVTQYYVRAYATSSKGTAYGEEITFKTKAAKASVLSLTATSVTSSSGILNASIEDDGGEAPSECGFYWSETLFTDPTSATKVVSSLSGSSFSANLTNLNRTTTYYYQAYSKNPAGISYGEVRSFTTSAILPAVITAAVSDITENSATCGGTVTDDGGADVTKRGVVWSTSPNPTVTLSTKTVDDSGNGDFTSSITGLAPMTDYYVRSYATNSVGTSYGEQRTFTTKEVDFASAQDLSSSKTANCYIVSSAGKYKFKTVKGNSATSVGSVSYCEVLWESFGTSTTPQSGDLIPYAVYKDDYIWFISSSSEGNAVIAAKDASGNILWSWHIWLTDEPKGQVYNNNAGVMMDRNLGATATNPGDVGALGLLYQWGRKDPFLGSSSISSNAVAKSTISWPSSVSSSSSTGSISYALAHPTTFITYNDSNYDWYYTGGTSTDNTRWQSSKTIYDPCPAGWRVPEGGSGGVWAIAFGSSSGWTTSSNWNSDYKGMDFSKTDKKLGSSGPIWYPASGYLISSGSLSSVGRLGYYWSVSPNGKYAYYLDFYHDGYVSPAYANFLRAYGQSVRCLQE